MLTKIVPHKPYLALRVLKLHQVQTIRQDPMMRLTPTFQVHVQILLLISLDQMISIFPLWILQIAIVKFLNYLISN